MRRIWDKLDAVLHDQIQYFELANVCEKWTLNGNCNNQPRSPLRYTKRSVNEYEHLFVSHVVNQSRTITIMHEYAERHLR